MIGDVQQDWTPERLLAALGEPAFYDHAVEAIEILVNVGRLAEALLEAKREMQR